MNIMDNDLVKRSTIINLLKSFININAKRKNMAHARECWEDDLDFVRNYAVTKHTIIHAKKIKILYKNRKN